MAVAVIQENRAVPGGEVSKVWKDRIEQARRDRHRYEPNWAVARAFAAGKHHLKWSRKQRRLVLPSNPKRRERYSVEEIGQYRLTAVGELTSDDIRPNLLFRQGDIEGEEMAKQINAALGYAWDEEIRADEILMDLKFGIVDLGTAAIRCVWDPDAGPIAGHLPKGVDGKPITDDTELGHLEANGTLSDGSLPKYKAINDGLIRLEVGAPENLLVPPGLEYQRDFPWEIWMRPVLIQDLIDEYGPVAEGLKEEPLSALQMLGSRELGNIEGDWETDTGQPGKLHGHCLEYICYERPSKKKPQGEMIILAHSTEMRPMCAPRALPNQAPDGTWRSGITYFHYQRVPGRFWGRGLIEVLKDPQRMIDRRRTQISETIDRGQPAVFLEKGSLEMDDYVGQPMEIIEINKQTNQPVFHPGMPPGPWMQAEVESCREDMARASGIQSVTLGENPTNVSTYSQLALLRESDQIKRAPMVQRIGFGVTEIVENIVYYIRTYWGHEKQITIAGELDGMLQSEVFDATTVPTFFKVEIAKGAAKPMTQSAKLLIIQDIWQAALTAGVVATDPARWLKWLHESVDAGETLPFPEPPQDAQDKVAEFENLLMVQKQEEPGVAEHDISAVHVPIHRQAQDNARSAGDVETFKRLQRHIDLHVQAAAITRKAWRFIDPTDFADASSAVALDEDQALRENQMIFAGQPLNPEAVQEAYAAIQAGTNPETGQQLQHDPATGVVTDNLHDLLLRASLKPTLVENLQLHLERHGNVIKSEAFKEYPPDARHRFLTHYDLTRDLLLSIPLLPTEVTAPKVSLSYRLDAGPTTEAEILRRAGVPDADPARIAAEPPLENMVQRKDPPADATQAGQHYAPRGPL